MKDIIQRIQRKIQRIRDDKRLLPARAFKKIGLMKHYVYLKTIILYTNTICNAKCSFCDIGIENIKNPKSGGAGNLGIARMEKNSFMSTEMVETILNDKAILNRRLAFGIIMTEPLISPNITDIVKLIKSRQHSVLITTNGFLLKKKAQGLVDAGVDRIQVSLDGTSELHNKIRGVKNLYEKAIDGINTIKNLNPNIHVRVNVTVVCENQDNLVKLADDLNQRTTIDRLKFQLMQFVTNEMSERQNRLTPIEQTISSISNQAELNRIDSKVLLNQFSILRKKQPTYQNIGQILFIPSLTKQVDIDNWYRTSKPLSHNDHCYIPFNQVAIKPNGEITWHMRCFDYSIGNILEGSLDYVFYKSDRVKFFRNELENNNYCMPACSRCCGVTSSGN